MKLDGRKVRSAYAVFLSIFTVVVGGLFIMQTWRIYTSVAQSPFSAESIQKYFRQIAVPVWLWVAAVVGGGVLSYVFKEEKTRPKAYVDVRVSLRRVKTRLPMAGYSSEALKTQKQEENFRMYTAILCGVTAIILGAFALLILLNVHYVPWITRAFFAQHEGLVDRLFQTALFTLLALGALAAGSVLTERSYKRERQTYIDILAEAKKAPKGEETKESQPAKAQGGFSALLEKIACWKKSSSLKEEVVFVVRIGVAVVGVAFFVWGICNGGMADVFLKAINICTQCIGLG